MIVKEKRLVRKSSLIKLTNQSIKSPSASVSVTTLSGASWWHSCCIWIVNQPIDQATAYVSAAVRHFSRHFRPGVLNIFLTESFFSKFLLVEFCVSKFVFYWERMGTNLGGEGDDELRYSPADLAVDQEPLFVRRDGGSSLFKCGKSPVRLALFFETITYVALDF